MPNIPQPKEYSKLKPLIKIGSAKYYGKDHGEAISNAEKAGEDISKVDRQKDGLFETSEGKIFTRDEAGKQFGIRHSSEIGQKKVLIITDEWLAPSLSLTIKNEGYNVFLAEKRPSHILKGTIKRIPYADRLEFAPQCDLIVYEDKSNGNETLELRAKGLSVIGGDKLTDKLELDRTWANKLAKQCGVLTPEMFEMQDFQEMKKFLKEKGGKWVLKQQGKIDEIKGLNFVAKMPNSEDLLDFLDILEKSWVDGVKKDFVLQEKIDGHEFAIGSFWNGKEFMKDKDGDELCEENFEHKSLFPGNLGESTGEQYCYDEQTEVLTNSGWKFWRDISFKDKLATLVNGKTEFEKPTDIVAVPFKGEMIGWKNRSVDILVTPNHWMYLQTQQDFKKGRNKFKLIQAENANDTQYSVKRTSDWSGTNQEYFTVNNTQIPFIEFSRFVGLYMAEGSCSNGSVNIAQSHPIKSKKVEEIIKKINLKYTKKDNGFVICNTELSRLLKPYGKSYEKVIPEFIKTSSKESIVAYLDGHAIGDAHTQLNGSRIFYTTSKKMADDLQELMLKCGRLGIIKGQVEPKKPCFINGRQIIKKHKMYVVYERGVKTSSWLDKKDRYTEYYDGKVYCATVSSHILFVRRNGSPMWCGNTVQHMVKAKYSKLFKETLDKCRPLLTQIDFRGDFDINSIVTEQGAYFLEFTPRMGVPATSGMLEFHKSSWYDLLKAMADGKQDSKFDYDPRWCIVSWLYTKPFPAVHMKDMDTDNPKGLEEIKKALSNRMSTSEGIKLNFKKDFTTEDWKHIHPDGIRFKDNRLEIANEDGYILTATQQDDTVEGAGKKLDDLLKKIIVPKGFWRNDFDKTNYHKAKEDLIKWGYLELDAVDKQAIEDKKKEEDNKVKENKRKEVRAKLKKMVYDKKN